MHSFEVSLGCESVDRSTFSMKRGSGSTSLKMYFGQCFHTPMKFQKNAEASHIIYTKRKPNIQIFINESSVKVNMRIQRGQCKGIIIRS
jgi:hypothetical protein